MAVESFERLRVGEILVKRKTITQAQLDHALDLQKKGNSFLGEILVKLGYLEDRDIVVALVVQCGLPYIAVNKYSLDKAIVAIIPKELAMRYSIIALDKIGDVLSVVMTNPLTEERKKQLESVTQCRVATFISTKKEIEEAIARNYT